MKSGDGWQVLMALGTIALAAVTSAALILLLRPLLARYALARPNARSSHVVPTPQGGGIAVMIATLIAAGVAAILLPGIDLGALAKQAPDAAIPVARVSEVALHPMDDGVDPAR